DFVTRLFVANTHTPILFFSSRGIVYKLKVWKLPLSAPQARGKALINILPLEQGERITTIMPLPEDEESWNELDIVFATTQGTVRRNKLSDFVQVNRNGKIAMKLDDGDGIVGVETCDEDATILLTSQKGQCIRFAVTDVRVFTGRNSVGVRGIRLAPEDLVISMTVLNPSQAEAWERTAFLKRRRALDALEEGAEIEPISDDEDDTDQVLGDERFEIMRTQEQMILAISENGFGKRSSSHEYRVSGRGGKGIAAMSMSDRNGPLISVFPVLDNDEIMLVTDGGQLIRCPISGIRVAGRSTQGVTVFKTAKNEKVVSVERVSESDEEDESIDGEGAEVSAEAGGDDGNEA
ncbi:MAG: DNA gyrase subunit A, partial [Rhizobiaceae bacterium]|nr:DNA gyrase subunit A [Rhizobiaceae bacterium]